MKKALVFDFYGTLFDIFSSSSRSSIETFKGINLDKHILYNELDRYHKQNVVDLKEFKLEKDVIFPLGALLLYFFNHTKSSIPRIGNAFPSMLFFIKMI